MNLKIYEKILLSNFSTFKIGGLARFFALPKNTEQIFEAIDFCQKKSLKPIFFGSGANILFPDKVDDSYFFISLRNLVDFEFYNEKLSLSSGFPISLLPFLSSIFLLQDNLSFLYLLPGTIGAATYINVRYDSFDIGPFLSKIIYLDLENLKISEIEGKNAEFSYKSSIFQKKNWIILQVIIDKDSFNKENFFKDFFSKDNFKKISFQKNFKDENKIDSPNNVKLEKYLTKKLNSDEMQKIFIEQKNLAFKTIKNESDLKKFYKIYGLKYIKKNLGKSFNLLSEKTFKQIEKIEDYRISKNHFIYPSCGSVFKNNYQFGTATGALVDKLGLKGFRHNDAQIAPYHGNIIINTGKAKASDVFYLVQFVQEKIYKNFGFVPEPEIIILR